MRVRLGLVGVLLVPACGDDGDQAETAWELPETTTGVDDPGTTGSDPFDTSGGDTEEVDDEGLDESSSGGESFDCTPAWTSTFVGSPCESDSDCSFDGGFCLHEDDGFPCGTCSQSCTDLCPDLEGTPTTFCVDGDALMVDSGGHCLSQCDPPLLGGNGCRDGYVCSPMSRYMQPEVSAGVCVPEPFGGEGATACQQMLLDLGAVFVPVDHEPESPDGFPELLCEIEDPVLLYSPIGNVSIRYIASAEEAPVFMGCNAAVSVVGSAAVAGSLGATELLHIGTYNCRTISGTSTLSQHGYANAIDIGGFTLEDGTEITVFDDWEDGNPNPQTEYGQWLREFTDQIWAMGLWNIILTPEYNAAHDDHFHIDLTPGGNTYD